MADPQQQPAKPSPPEFLLDDNDLLTPEDQAALDAEHAEPEPGEGAEPPEGLPAKQPAPAEKAPQADATEKPPKGGENVPYHRLQEVVKRNKELETALQEERERRARLDERVQMAREAEERARQQPQPPVEVPTKLGARPDATIDPIGADLWDAKREAEIARHEAAEARAGNAQTAEQVQASRQQQEFANWVNNDATTYRAQHPDYDAATAHAYQWRVKHWVQRTGMPEQEARAIVDQEAVATAMLARRNGKSAAQAFYELAQETGYQPNAPVARDPEVQPSSTQQGKQRLEQVRQGQKFQGLSRVPAERPENVDWSNMDAQAIADMPEDEFLDKYNDPVQGPQLKKALLRLENLNG